MQKLSQSDLWPLPVYETVRDQFRRDVIAAKKHRRITVGPYLTILFENRMTVKFQVQEILRVERISTAEAVREELEGFNEMIPERGELSATLMIELVASEADVAAQLRKLTGLSQHVWLEAGGARVPAAFDQGRDDGRRISAVQYVRFAAGPLRAALLEESKAAALVVDHPAYLHRAELTMDARRSIAADLEERGA
jgi:hypothetical protein